MQHPAVLKLYTVQQNEKFHPEGNAGRHTEKKNGISFPKHADVGAINAAEIVDRDFRAELMHVRDKIVYMVAQHMRICDLNNMKEKKRDEMKAHPYFYLLAMLHEADDLHR